MSSEQGRARILLVGLGPTALSALESLITRFAVLAVFREVEANASASVDPVAVLAQRMQIPVHADCSLQSIDAKVAELRPDCVVVSSYNRIIKASSLRACPFINVHYALLPRYRGRANVNWCMINGEPCTGISIHVLAPDLDSGNILFQKALPITEADTIATLYDQLNSLQHGALADTVERFLQGDQGIPQDSAKADYGCSRIPDDGEVNWCDTTVRIDRLIRALTEPFPGAYTFLRGRRLLLWRAAPAPAAPVYAGRIPGRVIQVSRRDGFVDVLTGDGVLRIWEIQVDGSPRSAAADAIRSVRDTLGIRSAEIVARIEDLEARMAAIERLRK